VFAFGDAAFYGSAAELGPLAAPIVSMTASPSGNGYWLVASDGGVFAFGDASFYGSASEGTMPSPLPSPVKALIPAPGHHGYWLLREDHEVMPFGVVDPPVNRRYIGIVTSRLL
jgi:hypothetical protein